MLPSLWVEAEGLQPRVLRNSAQLLRGSNFKKLTYTFLETLSLQQLDFSCRSSLLSCVEHRASSSDQLWIKALSEPREDVHVDVNIPLNLKIIIRHSKTAERIMITFLFLLCLLLLLFIIIIIVTLPSL